MITPIAGSTPTDPADSTLVQTQSAPKSATSAQKSSQAQPSSTGADTVKISSAAAAALQESLETKSQTAQEALKGDPQAVRLLLKEASAKKA